MHRLELGHWGMEREAEFGKEFYAVVSRMTQLAGWSY